MWWLLHYIDRLTVSEGRELGLLCRHVDKRRFLSDLGGVDGGTIGKVGLFREVVEDFDIDPRMAVLEVVLEINTQGVVVRSVFTLQEAIQIVARLERIRLENGNN